MIFLHHRNHQKNLKEHGSKITDAEKKAIEDASSSLKEALKGTDNEDIKKKTEVLVQASMKLGEAIYKAQEKNQTHLMIVKIMMKEKKTIT